MDAQPGADLIRMQASESERSSRKQWPGWSPQAVLLLTFAALYFAIGPGNFFATDEVTVEETAQALVLRRNLDIPQMMDARLGRAQSYYTAHGPGLSFASWPFVYLGLKLDDGFGSMNGGPLAGYPIGTQEEQPLRWSGRLALSTSLIVNALAGGAIVAMLFMVGMRLTGNVRASMLMAVATGLATTVMSEATHFFHHALAASMLITGFWFFAGEKSDELERRGLYGGVSLGIALLARPDAAVTGAVLWLYGVAAAWKLVRNFPDRLQRVIRRSVLAGIGPAASVAGYLYYNDLRFGSFTQFGYTGSKERLAIDAAQNAKAIIAYMLSPSLSIFLFAPPLILALAAGRWAFRRWPLETGALVVVAAAQLLLFSCYASWSGDVGYGPRFMFEAIVMLMPLTLPAFEAVADFRSRRATMTIAALVGFGMAVQLIGVAVYETVNEWYRANEGIFDNNAFVFLPSASPIIVDLKELVAGRNLAPWALRMWAHPGPALVSWIGLMVVVLAGGRWLAGYFRAPSGEPGAIASERLPAAIVLAAMLPILLGFALVRPIRDAPGIRAFNFLEAGLAAQAKGESVAASENYAMVLSLDPSNKFARYDLGILQQDAGYTGAALALYADALRADPNFTPARLRIASILQGKNTN